MKGKILVTGGTGYIGSHTVCELIGQGYQVVIVDNLSNSERFIVDRIEQITGTRPAFYEFDLKDAAKVGEPFCSVEGGWRVGEDSAHLLPQQSHVAY